MFKNMNEREPTIDCPCCGYLSLIEGQTGEICPICFWEYDGEVDYKITAPSKSNNGMTLEVARANFDNCGACEESMLKHVLPTEARKKYKHINSEKNKT